MKGSSNRIHIGGLHGRRPAPAFHYWNYLGTKLLRATPNFPEVAMR
jgi:hypothetical protein